MTKHKDCERCGKNNWWFDAHAGQPICQDCGMPYSWPKEACGLAIVKKEGETIAPFSDRAGDEPIGEHRRISLLWEKEVVLSPSQQVVIKDITEKLSRHSFEEQIHDILANVANNLLGSGY